MFLRLRAFMNSFARDLPPACWGVLWSTERVCTSIWLISPVLLRSVETFLRFGVFFAEGTRDDLRVGALPATLGRGLFFFILIGEAKLEADREKGRGRADLRSGLEDLDELRLVGIDSSLFVRAQLLPYWFISGSFAITLVIDYNVLKFHALNTCAQRP